VRTHMQGHLRLGRNIGRPRTSTRPVFELGGGLPRRRRALPPESSETSPPSEDRVQGCDVGCPLVEMASCGLEGVPIWCFRRSAWPIGCGSPLGTPRSWRLPARRVVTSSCPRISGTASPAPGFGSRIRSDKNPSSRPGLRSARGQGQARAAHQSKGSRGEHRMVQPAGGVLERGADVFRFQFRQILQHQLTREPGSRILWNLLGTFLRRCDSGPAHDSILLETL
jgi:hypothetical protein